MTGVIEIMDRDLVSMTDFPLHWRFTHHRADRWPPDKLLRLRPLSAVAAAAMATRTTVGCAEGGAFDVTFRTDDPPPDVRLRLQDLPPGPSEGVLVSWDARTAVVTDWETFVTSWDDFCYPSSDDVTVLPLNGAWVLCYRHYEVIQFRAQRARA